MKLYIVIVQQTNHFLSSGLFLLQLMADLHPVLVSSYLRQVDKDEGEILICEVARIAAEASAKTRTWYTPLADQFLSSLEYDANKNLMASFKVTTMDGRVEEHRVNFNKNMNLRGTYFKWFHHLVSLYLCLSLPLIRFTFNFCSCVILIMLILFSLNVGDHNWNNISL